MRLTAVVLIKIFTLVCIICCQLEITLLGIGGEAWMNVGGICLMSSSCPHFICDIFLLSPLPYIVSAPLSRKTGFFFKRLLFLNVSC